MTEQELDNLSTASPSELVQIIERLDSEILKYRVVMKELIEIYDSLENWEYPSLSCVDPLRDLLSEPYSSPK